MWLLPGKPRSWSFPNPKKNDNERGLLSLTKETIDGEKTVSQENAFWNLIF